MNSSNSLPETSNEKRDSVMGSLFSLVDRWKCICTQVATLPEKGMGKPHGQLVSVSSTHYYAFTADLSTLSSTRGL